ncbi:MAG: integrase, partial [Candidatus Aenigmatarchaeota archaeon]
KPHFKNRAIFLEPRAGFEPATRGLREKSQNLVIRIDWDGFRKFVYSNYMEKTAHDYWRCARQYGHFLIEGDLSPLKTFSNYKRSHVLKALAALSKFLGLYKEFRDLREAYGIKWSKGESDQFVIKRLVRANNEGDLLGRVRKVKEEIPQISSFIDLIATTGLRLVEAINAYNLIISLAREGKLGNYYEDSILKHYEYPEIFIRKTKKVFISIVPDSVIKEVTKAEKLTYDIIKKRMQRRRIELRFSDLREYWASKMVKYLKQPEIDFLMGHISANVFMTNYFNPIWIKDLKDRTLKGEKEILKEINETIT